MTDKITLAGGLRWMRDKFAAWLASVTVFTFLWVAVIVAVSVLFVWDGVWSRHQAPSSLDPLTFQAAGWVMRLWTVFGLAAALWCFRHTARWLGVAFLVTWLMTSVMTYGHALGFMMAGQAEKYASGAVAEKTLEINTTSSADRIATLERQKDGIRADRDADVQKFEAAIVNITSDGLNNDHLADVYRQDIAATQANARERIEAIDADINAILQETKTEQVAGEEAVAVASKFDPLYLTLAEWTDGQEGRPDDEAARAIAQKTGAFWAFLIEMVGGFGVALLYAVHAHMAGRKPAVHEEFSEDVPPGKVRVEMSAEEWAEYERAKEVHENVKQGAQKGARTRRRGNKIEAEREYMEHRVSEFMTALNKGMSPAQVAAKFGLTLASLDASYGRYFTAEEYDAFFGPKFRAEPEPEPPVASEPPPNNPPPDSEMGEGDLETPEETTDLNGGEISETGGEISEPDELEIPPEPKEWGISVYDPPANEEDEKDDAA